MENEYAVQQARNGEGILTYSAAVITKALKEIKTLDLLGRYITLNDLARAILELIAFLRKINPHPQHLSAIVIETQSILNLVGQISRVEGQQHLLDYGETLKAISKNEAKQGQKAVQQATKIAAEIQKDKILFIEDFDELLASTDSPEQTLDALLAIGPTAPQIYSIGGALPPMNGDKLPRTLPSHKHHKLKILVQGGVDAIRGEVVAGVMNSASLQGSLRERLGTQGIVKIKVADDDQQRYFAAAQCASAEIEVTVSAVIPLHPDQRRGQLALQLISIDARDTYIDLLRLALRQTELDFNE